MRTLLLFGIAATLSFCGASRVLPEQMDRCGWLWERGAGCVVFQPTDDPERYLTDLPAVPDSLVDIAVRLRGDVGPCQSACAPYYHFCVSGAVAIVCEPTDLGCGVLNEDSIDYCHTWTSPVYGTLLTQMHGHSDGDTVRAVGIIDCSSPTVCDMGCVLWDATFYDCPDTLSAVEHKTWGAIKSDFR